MHYDRSARAYWEGTRNHDVSQNYAALLDAIEGHPPYTILDLGCGPGRDLCYFRSLGHDAVGLDGSKEFVALARSESGCEVLHQDFLAMALPESHFDGVFANASLFHVPRQELRRVLHELSETLKPRGVLFCSNPRGNDEEGWSGDNATSARASISPLPDELNKRLIPLHPVTLRRSVGERVVGRESALCLGLSRVAPLRA